MFLNGGLGRGLGPGRLEPRLVCGQNESMRDEWGGVRVTRRGGGGGSGPRGNGEHWEGKGGLSGLSRVFGRLFF